MFKEENQDTPPNDQHFGVGSIMFRPKATYMVVQNGIKTVQLMNTTDFKLVHPTVRVSDINHFTETEVRSLHNSIGDKTTFSDYTYQPDPCTVCL